MTQRPPEPTAADLAAWRDLVGKARALAAQPDKTPTVIISKALKQARRSIVIGALSRNNPCVVLVNLSRQFVSETDRGRRELASRLTTACDEVAGLLQGLQDRGKGTSDVPPQRRPRADIDG